MKTKEENFAVIRTFNVEKIARVLIEDCERIVCKDSKLPFPLEIKFLVNEEKEEYSAKDKLDLIERVLRLK